jgi:integral membrane protein
MPLKNVVIRAFRILAVAEAFSWAALLIGMYFKWIAGTTEIGVQMAGPIHGALFVGYGIAALALWRLQRWPFLVALFAGVSAVFPFATILFERWAGKRGHLNPGPAPETAAASAWESSRV